MNKAFAKNLKSLRISKKLTQEQVAERLCVSPQTVSRWECGNGTPDVMMLPEIARLYCVTVDDLYKKNSIAYENYAVRLSSLYEYTRQPEDFIQADLEFRRLFKGGNFTAEDKRNYGCIHHFMMNYQTELIAEQKMQLQECLELNERLNRENRNVSVQVLQKDLKQAKDLLESVRGKLFQSEFAIESLQDKLRASEEAREYAETQQKVVIVSVKENVLYEKCKKCHKGLYDTALVGFVAYSLLVTSFAAVKSKVLVNDLSAFFIRVWNVIRWFVVWLVGGAKWVAQITGDVQNEALADVLYWLIVVIIVSAVIGGIGFGLYVGARKVRKIYLECCWDRVSVMVATISLAVVVYFGEEIRAVVPVNLVVIMLVAHGLYVAVRQYVKGWREARGIGRSV